jgi:S1-C subfamily serine protease
MNQQNSPSEKIPPPRCPACRADLPFPPLGPPRKVRCPSCDESVTIRLPEREDEYSSEPDTPSKFPAAKKRAHSARRKGRAKPRLNRVVVLAAASGGCVLLLALAGLVWLLAGRSRAPAGPAPELAHYEAPAPRAQPAPASPKPVSVAPAPAVAPVVPPAKDPRTPPKPLPKEPPATSPPVNTTRPENAEEKPAEPQDVILKRVKSAIAYLEGKKGSGSAFLVAKGILATNNHVLQDEYIDELQARFVSADNPAAKALPVKLLYRDRARDLVLLAVDNNEPPLRLSTAKAPPKGHPIAVVGHPSRFSGAIQELHAVTEGTVESTVMASRQPWYHLKADAAPGNSGGPVVDRKTGEVVGVLTFGIREQIEIRIGPQRIRPGTTRPQPRDTFCIPSMFVAEALKAVDSAEDRDKLSEAATARYAAELISLQLCIDQAMSKRASPAQLRVLSRIGSSFDREVVKTWFDLHDRLMERLKPAVQLVQKTKTLPGSTRQLVIALHQNAAEIRRMVEKPGTKFATRYEEKYEKLEKKHNSLRQAIWKELGLPDTVSVRLLD